MSFAIRIFEEDPTTYLNAESSRRIGICQCHCYLLDDCLDDLVLVKKAYLEGGSNQKNASALIHHVLPPAW